MNNDERIIDENDEVAMEKERDNTCVRIRGINHPFFESVALVIDESFSYLKFEDADMEMNERLDLTSPRIIECYDHQYEPDYYDLKSICECLNHNMRENLPNVPPMSLWDYIMNCYCRRTGNKKIEMPDYTSIFPHIIVDENDDNSHTVRRLEMPYYHARITDNMHLYLNINSYIKNKNEYFILTDIGNYRPAKKMARISFTEAKYIRCTDSEADEWILSDEEMQTLLLYFEKNHNWDMLLQHRDDQFNSHLNFIPFEGLPMPDYSSMKLNGGYVEMNKLERQLFRCCMRQIDYDNLDIKSLNHVKTTSWMYTIVEEFVFKKQCSEKQIWYYITKWSIIGIYDYGVNIAYGWFDLESMPERYKNIIPKRVIRKIEEMKGGEL